MSASRIVKRRAFKATDRSVTYHDYLIASGDRHPTFQSGIRRARRDRGHAPAGTDMHHFYGQRF